MQTLTQGKTLISNSNQEWEVEKIIRDRKRRKNDLINGKFKYIKEYLIKWVGYEIPSWEPEENLEHCQDILNDYLLRKTEKNIKKQRKTEKNQKYIKRKRTPNLYEKKNSKKKKLVKDNISNNLTSISNIKTNTDLINQKENKLETLYFLDIKEDENTFFDLNMDDNKEEKIKLNNIMINNAMKIKSNYEIYSSKDPKNLKMVINEAFHINGNKNNENNDTQQNCHLIMDEEGNINISQFTNSDKENSLNFSVHNIKFSMDDQFENDNIQILEIYGMEIPNTPNEGIILNIKFKKNNRIYIEEFNTKEDEIPYKYLVKYFEMFICENFKGQNFMKNLPFN